MDTSPTPQPSKHSLGLRVAAIVLLVTIMAVTALAEDTVGKLAIELCGPEDVLADNPEHWEQFRGIVQYYEGTFGLPAARKLVYIAAPEYRYYPSGAPLAISSVGSFEAMPARGYYLLGHELAHAYWGHTVMGTCASMTYLSEPFAVYSTLMAIRHIYGELGYNNFLGDCAMEYFKLCDQQVGAVESFALRDLANDESAPVDLHSTVRDAKGAWLLAMLEDYVGRDRFSEALKAYVNEYGRPRVYPEFQDFVALVGRETGEDVDWFVRGWYENDGEPWFDFSGAKWIPAYGDERTLQFELKQEGFVERLPVDGALTLVDGSVVTDTVWVEPGENQLELQVDGDGRPAKLELDPELKVARQRGVQWLGSKNLLVYEFGE